jgi:hypothetical protein
LFFSWLVSKARHYTLFQVDLVTGYMPIGGTKGSSWFQPLTSI